MLNQHISEDDRSTFNEQPQSNNIKQISVSDMNELNTITCAVTENGNKTNNIKNFTTTENGNIIINNTEMYPNNDSYSHREVISHPRNINNCSNKTSSNYGKHKPNDNKKDIYMVAEGYHKTDSCYYKTPDGGFHKLPPDSYHKMSEICYNKLPDGSFKRLVDIRSAGSGETGITGSTDVTNPNSQNKVRNHMIKFLKRSKSHSQATAKETYITYRKENQRIKDKETQFHNVINNSANITLQNSAIPGQNNVGSKSGNNSSSSQRHSNHAGNRKVVVTMMENGGLPIVATSKNKSPKSEYKTYHQSSIRDKVKSNDEPKYSHTTLSRLIHS